jgi:hypothetical protein
MTKLVKVTVIFILLMVSCAMPIRIPNMMPAANSNVCIEAFRLRDGMIFVVKSEIVPGKYYWEGSTAVPKRKRVWMEIYAAVNGRIELIKVYEAKCIPAKPEGWEWDVNEKKESK